MVRLALPKGRLQARTSRLLTALGIGGYSEGSRNYRPTSDGLPGLRAKVFQERDIPVQVAVGNYDLGICGFNWVEELTSKFPSSEVVVIKGLGYGRGKLCVAVPRGLGMSRAADLARLDGVAVATENPNLAEAYAARLRLKRFRVFPVWGSAEVYPSFAADIAIFCPSSPGILEQHDLVALDFISSREAFLVANRRSWESVDLGQALDVICRASPPPEEEPELGRLERGGLTSHLPPLTSESLRLALPDGHQQKHAVALLDRAGIRIAGYNATPAEQDPLTNLEGVSVRVIRPQDMPLQVANGNIDLAITGKDWLRDHLCTFPSSPVRELLDLKFGRVKLVAVVANGAAIYAAGDPAAQRVRNQPVRVASEYTNIADRYCRDKRLGRYKVIPTWGATEAFLPEDADLLIENTETGETLARHNLKVIDTLFESSGCLIGSTTEMQPERKRRLAATLMAKLAKAV
ncbi:MAG: ATP phosphoribosyltransferase [Chloroflexi bacterium]|nr:ATP phosphoribosyltransferase [Chloroflexota bacterium]